MEKEKLLELYKPLIEEISFEEFKEKCINREIDHLMPVSKAIVVDYMGNEPQVQADFLLNMLIDNEIVFSIELNPSKIFEKIYSIKSTNVTDIVAILKDNVISLIKIKSSAELLSSFIIGRYDLMTNDATLRIYTKMSNKGEGFAGFLRNFSLNSLANRISDSGRNDANYYSSEISQLPKINADEKDCQIFLTKVDGDVINFNFLSSLKRIK